MCFVCAAKRLSAVCLQSQVTTREVGERSERERESARARTRERESARGGSARQAVLRICLPFHHGTPLDVASSSLSAAPHVGSCTSSSSHCPAGTSGRRACIRSRVRVRSRVRISFPPIQYQHLHHTSSSQGELVTSAKRDTCLSPATERV
jgi:hypothetical protein